MEFQKAFVKHCEGPDMDLRFNNLFSQINKIDYNNTMNKVNQGYLPQFDMTSIINCGMDPSSINQAAIVNQLNSYKTFPTLANFSPVFRGFVGSLSQVPGGVHIGGSGTNVWEIFKYIHLIDNSQSTSPEAGNSISKKENITNESAPLNIIAFNPIKNMGLTYAEVTKLKPLNAVPGCFLAKRSICSEPKKKNVSSKLANLPFNRAEELKKGIAYYENVSSPLCKLDKVVSDKPVPHVNFHRQKKAKRSKNKKNSVKRELGSKKQHCRLDMDGSIWASNQREDKLMDDSPVAIDLPTEINCNISRTRTLSSDSECSSEMSDGIKHCRVRSLSECSATSVDSDDSFIVFECEEEKQLSDFSSEEESSCEETDDIDDVRNCDVSFVEVPSYIEAANSKWLNNVNKDSTCDCGKISKNTSNSPSPSSSRKMVRFADEDNLVRVHKLVVWNLAHRLARKGPWEEMARDRTRFSQRIASLASVISPVLSQEHRTAVYNKRFLNQTP